MGEQQVIVGAVTFLQVTRQSLPLSMMITTTVLLLLRTRHTGLWDVREVWDEYTDGLWVGGRAGNRRQIGWRERKARTVVLAGAMAWSRVEAVDEREDSKDMDVCVYIVCYVRFVLSVCTGRDCVKDEDEGMKDG